MDNLSQFRDGLKNMGIPFCEGEPLSSHSTFRIGGSARLFCSPTNLSQLVYILECCKKEKIKRYILGNGSNVLFSDEGFEGVVIHIGKALGAMSVKDNTITAGAGAMLSSLSRFAMEQGLSGLEFAAGIPGTVGGGIYMNAGAYGGEIRDVLVDAVFLDENNQLRTLPAEQLMLGYRTSIFSQQPWCLVQATFHLQADEPQQIQARMQHFMQSRREKQPLEYPSAGSTFKRPQGAYAAALIEQCGLKGYRVGGAAVSEKHSGFVVNLGGATCADVIQLTEDVARIVKEKTGFVLEREVRVVE